VLPPQHPFFASLIVVLALLDTTLNSFIALEQSEAVMLKVVAEEVGDRKKTLHPPA